VEGVNCPHRSKLFAPVGFCPRIRRCLPFHPNLGRLRAPFGKLQLAQAHLFP
jgi:hypothetical protein